MCISPDTGMASSFTFSDPATGESNLTVYRFNSVNPMAGDAVEENATGYLMRNAQWLVQEIGVDRFRIDAAKHVPTSTLNYFDRAVFRANPRTGKSYLVLTDIAYVPLLRHGTGEIDLEWVAGVGVRYNALRDWGASAHIPFFGGMTSTDRVATLPPTTVSANPPTRRTSGKVP